MTGIKVSIHRWVFILLLVFSTTGIAAGFPGDELLGLASEQAGFDDAAIWSALENLRHRLSIPEVSTFSYAGLRLLPISKFHSSKKRKVVSKRIVLINGDAKIDVLNEAILIATGSVDIAFAIDSNIIAGGAIDVNHFNSTSKGRKGMLLSKGKLKASHIAQAFVYAEAGFEYSRSIEVMTLSDADLITWKSVARTQSEASTVQAPGSFVPPDEFNSWFEPTLVLNEDPVCDQWLQDAREVFAGKANLYRSYISAVEKTVGGSRALSRNILQDPEISFEETTRKGFGEKTYTFKTPVVSLNGEKLYLHELIFPGCGGACERYALLPSTDPDYAQPRTEEQYSPMASGGYRLYKSNEGRFWVAQLEDDDSLLLLEIVGDRRFKSSCRVKLKPDPQQKPRSPASDRASGMVSVLRSKVKELTRGAGSCGSLRTHSRWARYFDEHLELLWYRPWALAPKDESSFSFDEYGTYEKDLQGLSDWALLGHLEREALTEYFQHLERTIPELASHYQDQNGWPADLATYIARTALSQAVSSTVRFYYFKPFDEAERKLRQAILDQRPLDEIKQAAIKLPRVTRYHNESLLNIATGYPRALEYLLEQGLDPNHRNDFGKTPLMYAAQYNHLEGVRLLLEYGADPNQATIKPNDHCFYTIATVNVTALHYAARYASAQIIEALIDAGAVSYIKAAATGNSPQISGTALQWLDHFTGNANPGFKPGGTEAESVELNPNIAQSQVPRLRKVLLQAQNVSADQLVVEGEALYQQGDILQAHRKIYLALQREPGHPRALSDMSLIAFRMEKPGESLEASAKLIGSSNDDTLLANAYFNQGLICETQKGNRIRYNGRTYCRAGHFYPFYQSLKHQDTPSRRQKILDLFVPAKGLEFCRIAQLDITLRFAYGRVLKDGRFRKTRLVYILHDDGLPVSAEQLSWEGSTLTVSDSLGLGQKRLTVLESDTALKYPVNAFGHQCHRS